MGLDIVLARIDWKRDHPRWSYGGFHAFRERLAREVGITLDSMQGFGGELAWASVADPLVPLLTHSDCDGEMSEDDCECVAPRLREIVSRWPAGDYDRDQAELLADYMDEVLEHGGRLIFA